MGEESRDMVEHEGSFPEMVEEDSKKRAFFNALSISGNISEASRNVGMNRITYYRWKWDSPAEVEEATNIARDIFADRLESEARRRAIEGVEEPVFFQGEKVGSKLKYSDTLLIFLMKGERPEKYAERSLNLHHHQGNISLDMTDEELKERIKKLEENLAEKE